MSENQWKRKEGDLYQMASIERHHQVVKMSVRNLLEVLLLQDLNPHYVHNAIKHKRLMKFITLWFELPPPPKLVSAELAWGI